MENSCLFIRGQVWYWEDPIYGRKENNMEVSIGEGTLRYNRYCIIAQTTETINRSSVLVIPCSSSNHAPSDISVSLTHLFHDNFTYARTLEIFPVHPKFLQRYICTLPDEIMKEIETELIRALAPTLVIGMEKSEFLERFGINMEQRSMSPPNPKKDKDLEANIRLFVMEHLIRADTSFSISAYELKDAFNQYCAIHRLSVVDDIVEFLDAFTRLTNNTYHFSDRHRYNLVEFRGIRIRGNLKLSIDIGDQDIINQNDPQKPGKWNDQNIKDFITTYDQEGADIASEKFGLKPSTATNYWYRWKDRLDEAIELKPIVTVPPTTDIPRSISKVSNMIRDSLKELDVYSWNNEYESSIDNRLSESQFYSNLGTSIYYSLLDFLGIMKEDTNTFFIPHIDEYSENLESYFFFERAYHDKRISMKKTGLDLISAYRACYPEFIGINPEWIGILHRKLMNKLNMIELGVSKICETIQVLYCEK